MKEDNWILGIVENDENFRAHVVEVLKGMPQVKEVLSWNSAEEFWRDERGQELDQVYLDINLPNMNGVDLVGILNIRNPEIKIVMLSMLASDDIIFKALSAGALGYVLKTDLANLEEVTRQIMAGGAFMTATIAFRVLRGLKKETPENQIELTLTTRERQVLEQLVSGISTKQAAERLGITIETLRSHIKNIYKKLNVNNKVEMMRKASQMGLL